jgi:RNA polymerase sigma factor (sigma-70 family)
VHVTEALAEVDDADLISRLAHDPAALEEFYRRHVRALTRYAARVLGHREDADDVVAATFLAAIESSGGFDPRRGRPVAWLYGIAGHQIATRRRRSAAESRAVRRLGGQVPSTPDDEYGRVEDRLDAQVRSGPADGALESLPEAERHLMALIVYEELTVPEAAARLGIRPGTARMRLARARTRLALRRDDRHGERG